jgi:cyclic pyranopterin monophosphate synthase
MKTESSSLTHLDARGDARMVDVGAKSITERLAVATAQVKMRQATLEAINSDGIPKGDVFATARIAGIQAAKQCSSLIPLCHPLLLTSVKVTVTSNEALPGVDITARCKVTGQTGVEMEALTAASVTALTIYDMCKAIDRSMVISNVQLEQKEGGASGDWQRDSV